MKQVPRLDEAPPELVAYRTANPRDVTVSGADAGAAWERFRDDAAYVAVRAQLVECQLGLCGYCEQRLTLPSGALIHNDQQIEHVLAKSGGTGRTLDPANFMLCCSGGTYREKDPAYLDRSRHYSGQQNVSCGQRKGDGDLRPGCDPRSFPCEPRLVSVGLDGKLAADAAACGAVGVDPTELDKTINEILNLNCERLRLARKERVRAISEEVVWLATELLARVRLSDADKQSLGEQLAGGRLAPDAHGHLCAFWTTERQYLEPWSSTWLAKNAHRLGGPPASTGAQQPVVAAEGVEPGAL